MRRVVITGMGIVSSIGNNTQEVLASLHEAKSGITRAEKYAELGFRSQVQGAPTLNPADVIDRRVELENENGFEMLRAQTGFCVRVNLQKAPARAC